MPALLIPALLAGGLAVGLASATALATFGASTLFFNAFASTLVLSAAAQALQKKPSSGDLSDVSRTTSLKTPIGSRQMIYGQTRVGGQLTFASVIGVNFGTVVFGQQTNYNKTMNLVITFSGHEVEEIGDIWFSDQVVPLDADGNATGFYQFTTYIDKRLGTDDDALFSVLSNRGAIPAAFRQNGCSKIYVSLSKNIDKFPNGVPNITAVIKGRNDIYDPRTGLTGYSDNLALCVINYLCTPKVDGGCGADYDTEVNEPALIAAANICDETVLKADGTTEKRYTASGSFLTSVAPQDNIKAMLSGMAGTLVYAGGQWFIRAGAWVEPEITLDDGDARGPIQVQARMSRAEIFNAVKGVYTSPANSWQPTDFPPAMNALYLAEDGDEQLFGDISLPFTSSSATAQRLAKIYLEKARQQITETFPGKLSCARLRAGDTVLRTSADMGWVDKPFEVVDFKWSIYTDDNGAPALGVDLTLRETASTVYDWNAGEETTVDPAPDSNLPNPFSPSVPGIVSITEELYATTGSAGVKSRAIVELGVTDGQDNPDYGVEYQLVGESKWTVRTSKNFKVALDDMEPGTYDFRARTFNELNVASEYSATVRKEIVGLTAPPADVTGFSVRSMAGLAWVLLDKSPDLDVIQGGRLILRWSPNTSAGWNEGSLLAPDGYPGDSVSLYVPLMSGTYMAKFRDSTGNLSEAEASFNLTESALTDYNTLATVTEDPTFAGTKIGLAVVGGGLQLSGASAVDDITLIDSVADFDGEGGTATAGTYTFANAMNLGSLKKVRLFPTQRGLSFDTGDTIDDRAAPIDEWKDVDGDVVDDVESTIWVRTTQTNPAGSPVWTDWHPLMGPADYEMWAAQFQLIYASADQSHNRNVDQLRVAAKELA